MKCPTCGREVRTTIGKRCRFCLSEMEYFYMTKYSGRIQISIKTALKNYNCSCCGNIIRKGEKYEHSKIYTSRYNSKTNPYETIRLCMNCVNALQEVKIK